MRQGRDAGRQAGHDQEQVRGNALWGGGKRSFSLTVVAILAVVLAALGGTAQPAQAGKDKEEAFVPQQLLEAAKANPEGLFNVIVQGRDEKPSADVADEVSDEVRKGRNDGRGRRGLGVKRKFLSVAGTSAELTGRQIVKLADKSWVLAITEDAPALATYSNDQLWVGATELTTSWAAPSTYSFPTIAIVDSGVQPRGDFGTRLKAQVSFVSSGANSAGDGFGHGTLVAGIAAGSAEGYSGAAPQAGIVSLDVLNDAGVGQMSDVIAACDWILANKARYNIRVANFSINAGGGASVLYDPLDRAVEKLWLNGIVVVTAAGNYAQNGEQSGVRYSPANDPFVITVGASDPNGTAGNGNDFAAPWSAWGYTYDGFFKPEISAPGRKMTSTVPATSKLALLFPGRIAASGYMWMSGTSFAAPVVAGAASYMLAKYPHWTPDEVKGALMLDADVPTGYGSNGALGVGVLDADGAIGTSTPPNPNAALHQFVKTNSRTGLKVFDAASWSSAARADASWSSASWSSASWSSASWSSASWSSASWSSASWSSASWSSGVWGSASWASNGWVE
jgi:serine protease AprX